MILCRVRDWDTNFFGIRIGEICRSRLDAAAAAVVRGWAIRRGVRCVYYLCPADDDDAVMAAEGAGFHLVDVRVVFEADPRAIVAHGAPCRPVRDSDVPRLRTIAGESYGSARFIFDARFPPGRGRALYEYWIEKSSRESLGTVLVYELGGVPAGFVTYEVDGDESRIGLVGVAAEARGQGVGAALLGAAAAATVEAGAVRLTVATQGRNVAAQRLYQRSGFITKETGLWYHLWV